MAISAVFVFYLFCAGAPSVKVPTDLRDLIKHSKYKTVDGLDVLEFPIPADQLARAKSQLMKTLPDASKGVYTIGTMDFNFIKKDERSGKVISSHFVINIDNAPKGMHIIKK